MQLATELGDDNWLSGRDVRHARISFVDFNSECLEAFACPRREWSVSAERDPVAIVLAWKIILERVPLSLGLIVPVDVPDPGQIVRAFPAHKIDNAAVSRDVALRSFSRAAVPFPVPTEPIPVRFGPPFN